MLAPTDQAALGRESTQRAEVVVAVRGGADPGEALRTGQRLRRQLVTSFPARPAAVLLLSESAPEGAAAPSVPPDDRPALLAWPHPGQTALEAALRAAATFDAAACALVTASAGGEHGDDARQLLAPILEDGCDFVCPCYPTHRYEGVVNTGIVYPLTRATFGKRLRQPIGAELAVSRRLADHLLGEGWHADPAHAGGPLWLVTAVLSREFRVCQAYLRGPPPACDPGGDLAASLARVVGLLFHGMRLHAAAWQRVKGSQPVKAYGEAGAGAEPDTRPPQVASMLSAFQLGYQELGRLWGAVLPPQALLALKRLSKAPEESFSFDDALWARIVYDFAVGYHLAAMDRALLLRSMTPLYLGWAAGWVRDVRDLDAAGVDARLERLCRAFESAKPYLISRWRWPDRFNP